MYMITTNVGRWTARGIAKLTAGHSTSIDNHHPTSHSCPSTLNARPSLQSIEPPGRRFVSSFYYSYRQERKVGIRLKFQIKIEKSKLQSLCSCQGETESRKMVMSNLQLSYAAAVISLLWNSGVSSVLSYPMIPNEAILRKEQTTSVMVYVRPMENPT